METKEEVKELEELLDRSKFIPIENPIKKWFKRLKTRIHNNK